MADEVSKKDLQALEKKLGKQIGDLDQKVNEQKKDVGRELEECNAITVRVNQDLTKRCDELSKRCDDLQNGINALAKAISEVAGKVGK